MSKLGRLNALPRVQLGHTPTPLEAMANLGRSLGLAALHTKRDDCTGLAFGGNKVRQLEFYLGDALDKGADTIMITGATQSNFARLTAAAAARLGLSCHIQLEHRVERSDSLYQKSGNVLLNQIFGATLHYYARGEDESGADRHLGEIAEQLRTQGKHPYIIQLSPGHSPLGALGYVAAAEELLAQLAARDLHIDNIVVGSGSGHTHGGLLFGLRALGSTIRVTGICVRRAADLQRERITARCEEIGQLLAMDSPVKPSDIVVSDEVLAPGYGCLNPATVEAIQRTARLEGLLLDPVYTGKVVAGLIREASDHKDEQFLFWHTGGTPALFAYEKDLTTAPAP